jgi:hypothetical protein
MPDSGRANKCRNATKRGPTATDLSPTIDTTAANKLIVKLTFVVPSYRPEA